jgi:hypothetical protein
MGSCIDKNTIFLQTMKSGIHPHCINEFTLVYTVFISWNFNIQLFQYIYLNNDQWDSSNLCKSVSLEFTLNVRGCSYFF